MNKRTMVAVGIVYALTLTGAISVSAKEQTQPLSSTQRMEDKYLNSTFGFASQEVMTEDEKIKQAYEERERKAQYILNSDKKVRAGLVRREIKQQESLIFIAKQQLNGKTPVYGKEKEDLERIIKDARAKIAQLEKDEGLIKSEKGDVELTKQILKDAYPEIDEYEAVMRGEKVNKGGFFNYDNDNNTQISKNLVNHGTDKSKVRSQDALNAVDGVINKMSRDGSLRIEKGDKHAR